MKENQDVNQDAKNLADTDLSTKSVYAILSSVDCSKFTEKKNGLTYLSWSHAWHSVKIRFPNAKWEKIYFDGKPYLFDEKLGYMVETEVTIEGETLRMQLPIMDSSNKAQKHVAYTYKTKYGDKSVEPATMFDINTAIMRCMVKNLALFGLGINIYAGEDLPLNIEDEDKDKKKGATPPPTPPAPKKEATPPPPPAKWMVLDFDMFKEKLVNMPILEMPKAKGIFALKVADDTTVAPADMTGIACKVTVEQGKEYVKLHTEALKALGFAIPTELT